MNQSTALTRQPQRPATMQIRPAQMDPFQLAQVFYKSGLFKDLRDEAQAAVKILYGAELGIPPMQAMLGVYVVEGKPTLSATTMASIIKRSGRYRFVPVQHDATICILEFFERVGTEWSRLGESVFSMADAAQAGLAGKNTWKAYPKAMLWARALSQGARWYAADVFGGPTYTPEEFGAEVDEDGVLLPAPPSQLTTVAPTKPTTAAFDPDAEPRPDAEIVSYMADGKAVWRVAGVECVLSSNHKYLISMDACPEHDQPFALPLDPADTDWRHGKGDNACHLGDVLLRQQRGTALDDLDGLFDAAVSDEDR